MEKAKTKIEEIKQRNKKDLQIDQYAQSGWKFVVQKSGILPSDELDQLADYLILNQVPDVVFGYNTFLLICQQHDFIFEVNPRESLRLTNFKSRDNVYATKYERSYNTHLINIIPHEVKVKANDVWKNKQITDPEISKDVKQIEQISDCFFSTPYQGTSRKLSVLSDYQKSEEELISAFKSKINLDDISNQPQESDAPTTYPYSEQTQENIPLGNLTEANPIIWTNLISLWEDELGDNGITQSDFRFRVMGDCFFGLIRHYLRVDDVLIRIYDTRIYHDFQQNYILREFQAKEETWANIASKGFQFTPQWMIDPAQANIISSFLELQLVFKDKIYFKAADKK